MCGKNIFNVSSPVSGSLSKRPTPHGQLCSRKSLSICSPLACLVTCGRWRRLKVFSLYSKGCTFPDLCPSKRLQMDLDFQALLEKGRWPTPLFYGPSWKLQPRVETQDFSCMASPFLCCLQHFPLRYGSVTLLQGSKSQTSPKQVRVGTRNWTVPPPSHLATAS